jgi:hypothetical protein
VFFDPTNNAERFYQGSCNPRLRGKLQGLPDRTVDSEVISVGVTDATFGRLVPANGYVWFVGNRMAWSSPDGTTWTNRSLSTAPQIYSAAANDDFVFVSGSDGSHRDTYAVSTTVAAWRISHESGDQKFIGLATQGPYLYGWSGVNLLQTDVSALTGSETVAWTAVDDSSFADPPSGTTWYGDCLATENMIVYFTAYSGFTRVRRFDGSTGVGYWTLPQGFTGTCMTYSMGILYVAGVYENGDSALFMVSFADDDPQPLGYIRRGDGLFPVAMAPSFNGEILILSKGDRLSGHINLAQLFVYSPPETGRPDGAISYLGAPSLGNTAFGVALSTATFESGRLTASVDTIGGNYVFSSFGLDTDSTTNSWDFTGKAWDFQLPEQSKVLNGFSVNFAPISGSETITVSYQVNEDGTWHALSVIDSGTTGASTGSAYITVGSHSTHVPFTIIRFKASGTNGAVLYSLTARAYALSYQEVWEATLLLSDDETSDSRTGHGFTADQRRDFLIGKGTGPESATGFIPAKRIVQLKDGTAFGVWSDDEGIGVNSVDVIVESPEEVFLDLSDMDNLPTNQGERTNTSEMTVTLRSVAP